MAASENKPLKSYNYVQYCKVLCFWKNYAIKIEKNIRTIY